MASQEHSKMLMNICLAGKSAHARSPRPPCLPPIPPMKGTLHAACRPVTSVCVCEVCDCSVPERINPAHPPKKTVITEIYLHNFLLHIEEIISILDSSVAQTHTHTHTHKNILPVVSPQEEKAFLSIFTAHRNKQKQTNLLHL